MKFLVDAHLPRRLAKWLQAAGHDALHTLELPDGNGTTDTEINAYRPGNTVRSLKDADFVNSLLLTSLTSYS